jgi:hypothetical protein
MPHLSNIFSEGKNETKKKEGKTGRGGVKKKEIPEYKQEKTRKVFKLKEKKR